MCIFGMCAKTENDQNVSPIPNIVCERGLKLNHSIKVQGTRDFI